MLGCDRHFVEHQRLLRCSMQLLLELRAGVNFLVSQKGYGGGVIQVCELFAENLAVHVS